MSDANTTVADLRRAVAEFVSEREWEKFHNPKDLAVSISIEASEILEAFQWSGENTLSDPDDSTKAGIAEEVADVVIYCLSMANALGIDLSSEVLRKIRSNAERYPADEYRGRYR
jgi:NTP pyrophosphatase (non-canonical NTP hydrolase)